MEPGIGKREYASILNLINKKGEEIILTFLLS